MAGAVGYQVGGHRVEGHMGGRDEIIRKVREYVE